MSRVRAIPTSRAYWELRAEQVMNWLFAPEPSIDLEIIETAPSQPSPAATPQPKRGQHDHRLALAAGLAVLTVGGAGASMAGWGLWMQHQQALQQERNLLLIERLRNLNTNETATGTPTSDTAISGSGSGPDLPPPPPDEPWMQELAQLPASSAPAARVLQVPVGQSIGAAPPPAHADRSTEKAVGGTNPLPQLVGVIQIPGRGGSAIFQIPDGSSTSAGVGESIGNTGWRLHSSNGDSAIIEKNGMRRTDSISGGL